MAGFVFTSHQQRLRRNHGYWLTLAMVRFGLALLLTACEASQNDGIESPIRDIAVTCYAPNVPACGAQGQFMQVHIVLTQEYISTCESILVDANRNPSSYAAKGQANLLYDPQVFDGVTAVVSEWLDSDLNLIATLPSSTYRACSYIDVNYNQIFDAGDVVGAPHRSDSLLRIADTDNEIVDWRSTRAQAGI